MKKTLRHHDITSLPALLLLTMALVPAGVGESFAAQSPGTAGEDGGDVLTIDHYVPHVSTVASIDGEYAQLYVRERVRASTIARPANLDGRVALFVHGAGTPAEVAFDVPHSDYSWMEYLAEAGFDVFSVDMTGYGRSTRPHVMNDPCNLDESAQRALGVGVALASCQPSHVEPATTIASDWDDIHAAVEYVKNLRGVDDLHLLAWSLGGPRAGGYATIHPENVRSLVLLAPAYNRNSADQAPSETPRNGTMTSQSHADFTANWDRQVGCETQYAAAVSDAVWSEMLASDPVGATWGPGIRRAPRTTTWGWNTQAVGGSTTPTLIVAGVHDAQVTPERVRPLYDDLGSTEKVLIDLGCSSHNAMWETNHLLLFEASREWIEDGTVNGESSGIIRMGY